MESCLSRAKNEKFRTFKQSHIEFCEGNFCAAGIIDLFDKVHRYVLTRKEENKKENVIAENHGDMPIHSEHLLKAIRIPDFQEYLIGMFSDKTIRTALKLLTEKKIISSHKNPNPKYRFDKRNHYQFHPEVFNSWLGSRDGKKGTSMVEDLPHRSGKSDRGSLANLPPEHSKFTAAIDNKENNKETNQEPNLGSKIGSDVEVEKTQGLVEGLFFDGIKNPKLKMNELGNVGAGFIPAQEHFLEEWASHIKHSASYQVSSPKQLLKEVQHTLLDYTQLIGCENNFYRKLAAIDNLVRSGKWTTPFKLQKKKLTAQLRPSTKKNKTVVTLDKKLTELAQKAQELQSSNVSDENFLASLESLSEGDASHGQAITNVKLKIQQRQAEIKTLIATQKNLVDEQKNISEGENA